MAIKNYVSNDCLSTFVDSIDVFDCRQPGVKIILKAAFLAKMYECPMPLVSVKYEELPFTSSALGFKRCTLRKNFQEPADNILKIINLKKACDRISCKFREGTPLSPFYILIHMFLEMMH